MCCDTKQKIAQALRQLMLERPLKKITVQDLMERTQMKRQTFYYHFDDIYDLLKWLFEWEAETAVHTEELLLVVE